MKMLSYRQYGQKGQSMTLFEKAVNTRCYSRIDCLPVNERTNKLVKERLKDLAQTSQYWLNELDDDDYEYEYWKGINEDVKMLLK